MLKWQRVRLVLTAVVGVAAFVGLSGPVSAAAPTFHDKFNETIPNVDICGATGTLHSKGSFVGTDTGTSFVVKGQATDVFTTADGRTAVIHTAGVTKSSFTQNGDIVTIVDSFIGLPEQISSRGSGGTVLRDAGVIVFITTIDLGTGDVTTEVVVKGPHPEAESDFTLFCDAFLTALG